MTPADLQAWRTSAGLSQAGLAALLGVNVMTVSRWERGLRSIPPFLHLALKALDHYRWPMGQPSISAH
jgi:transcriptional regulator with XRE-family HTH domain